MRCFVLNICICNLTMPIKLQFSWVCTCADLKSILSNLELLLAPSKRGSDLLNVVYSGVFYFLHDSVP